MSENYIITCLDEQSPAHGYHEVMRFFRILFFVAPLMAQDAAPGSVNTTIQTVSPVSSLIPPDRVVIQVGDVKVTAAELDALIDIYPPSTQVFVRGPGRQQFADSVVRMLVLSEEARKRKIDETEKFKQQAKFSRNTLLSNLLSEQIGAEMKADPTALRAFYEEHRCDYQIWKPRQIVVRGPDSPLTLKPGDKPLTEAESLAKVTELRKRVLAGTDFSELARSDSDDASAAAGGSLCTVRHGQTFPSIGVT